MIQPTDEVKARAEARFQRQQDNEVAAAAGRTAFAAKASAERDKTARLRALRLAKEEADRAEAISRTAAKPKSVRAAKPQKAPA